ncbi:MAG: hypothetical protein J6A61_00880 [Clostridia bacterium]|nr:hypothetical protein [Clostridia bacterium]
MQKQWSVIFLIALFCVVLAGCGNTSAPTAMPESVTSPNNEQNDIVPTDATSIPELTVTPVPVITSDEDAIKQVVITYGQAVFACDDKTAQDCFLPGISLKSREEGYKVSAEHAVNSGKVVETDVDRLVAIQKNYNKNIGSMIVYQEWDVSISDDTAVVKAQIDYPHVDYEKIYVGTTSQEFQNNLYRQICGMDEQTAKKTLSAEEYSDTNLKFYERCYELELENILYRRLPLTYRLQKVDDRWYITSEEAPWTN